MDAVCNSAFIAYILIIVKGILFLIQIIGPILLIISLVINLINLMQNPDNKKKIIPKIKNSVIATFILFFIPLLVGVVMNLVDSSYDFAHCYNNVKDYFSDNNPSYIEIDDREKVIINNDKYESGVKNNNSNSNISTIHDNNNNDNINSSATASSFLNSLSKMSNYVKNDSKNTWYYLWDGSSKTFDDAVSRNNKHLTCISLPNWGLRDIGVLTPSQQFNQSPSNNNVVVYKNGAKEAIEKVGTIYHYGLSKSFKDVVNEIELVPGDIFVWDAHTNVYAGKSSNGKTLFYDTGRGGDGKYINGKFYFNSFGPVTRDYSNSKVRDVIRLNK